MILPQEIIRKKRDRRTLSADEIAEFIDGLTSKRISEGQAAAFAMAVFFNGLTREETVALTRPSRGSTRRDTSARSEPATASASSCLRLALLLQIVRSHHGKIAVESSVDAGTTFRVELPRVHA
jgi:hypothetical protein